MSLRASAMLICIGTALGVAGTATAQTAPNPKVVPKRDRELIVGGVLAGPASMGSAEAVLLGPNGTPSLTLFQTKNTLASGFGPELILGYRIRPSMWFEVAAGLTRARLSTRITDDFENAPAEVLAAPVIRVSAEGAIVWYFRQRGNTSWFLRGSGGFMNESSDLSAAEQGFIGGGGIGFRRWWRTAGTGTFKRLGLRAELRGVFRSGGISLAQRSWTFGPAGAVHLVFGY